MLRRLGNKCVWPASSIDAAVKAAQGADAALLFVGSSRATDIEGQDRASMDLEGGQNELVNAVLAAIQTSLLF